MAPSQGPSRGGKRATNLNPRRNPEGTPDVLKDRNPKRAQVQQQQHSKINEVLKGDEIKQWIRSRNISPGVLDMSVSLLAVELWLTRRTFSMTHGSKSRAFFLPATRMPNLALDKYCGNSARQFWNP